MARNTTTAIDAPPGHGEVTTGEKVRFLGSPDSYRGRPPVRTIETHMSWVFIAGDIVYKFKKPVRYAFLDFSSLEKRLAHCAAELTLNRRLAPAVYRRVMPLTLAADGALELGGRGDAVEWLVEMARLPEVDMLDHRLRAGSLVPGAVVTLGNRLGAFYADAEPQVSDGSAYLEHLWAETAANRELMLQADCPLPRSRVQPLLDRVESLLQKATPAIRQRIANGWIVEGHGDLRPEHVWLGTSLQIIDCLEFDRAMRLLDPYDEVNYLGLECELLGASWVRPLLLDTVDRYLERRPDPRLLATYGAFRGMLRARICLAHLLDPVPMQPERWPAEAERYLALAERDCAQAMA